MTEKELKKLSRKDLLYILVSQGKELQELKADYENAQAALKDRSIHLENRKFMEQDGSSMRRKSESLEIPETERLEAELNRVTHRSRFHSVLRSTIYTLIVVAAVSVLVATIWLPILQIYGASMTPTLKEGDIVVSVKGTKFQSGDLIAFYV